MRQLFLYIEIVYSTANNYEDLFCVNKLSAKIYLNKKQCVLLDWLVCVVWIEIYINVDKFYITNCDPQQKFNKSKRNDRKYISYTY